MIDIFAKNLTRLELLKEAKKSQGNAIKINVYRNFACEPICSVMPAFLAYSHLKAEFAFSDYDDSFSEFSLPKGDLELVCIDLANYKDSSILGHLLNRLENLRQNSQAPIFCILLDIEVAWFDKVPDSSNISDCFIFSISQMLDSANYLESMNLESANQKSTHLESANQKSNLESSPPLLDLAKFELNATRLSNYANIALAQILGLKFIPALLLPAIKALAIDLDNTLYSGILGEDGIEKIEISSHHKMLQEAILNYKKQGILLILASKNELQDVENLFKQRSDFKLKLSDFDFICVNWQDKASNITNAARFFNIGLDSILLLDDNIAEIASANSAGIKTLLAINPLESIRRLHLYPQLTKLRISKEDALRSSDIAANAKRERLANLSDEEYFDSLKLELDIGLDSSLERCAQLLNKTNQFISNYTRPSLESLRLLSNSSDSCVINIAMRDSLSDSGIIAIFVLKNSGELLEVLDLCISCRALGRRIEKIMLFLALNYAKRHFESNATRVKIAYKIGERNKPFLDFLDSIKSVDTSHSLSMTEESCHVEPIGETSTKSCHVECSETSTPLDCVQSSQPAQLFTHINLQEIHTSGIKINFN